MIVKWAWDVASGLWGLRHTNCCLLGNLGHGMGKRIEVHFQNLVSFSSQLAPQMSMSDWIWKGIFLILLWLTAIKSAKNDVPMTTVVIFLHMPPKHFTIRAFGKYRLDSFPWTTPCLSRLNLRALKSARIYSRILNLYLLVMFVHTYR